jgi:D-lactate dehydrogenase (cytochrome)
MHEDSQAFATLAARYGARFSRSQALREQHGGGETHHAIAGPDAVFFAESTAEVAEAVKLCAAEGIPVIAFGAGTSLEGHLGALHGGLSLDLTRMRKILRVSPDDLDCTVEAGVTREDLNSYLRDQGLFFPVDPGANATIGGMAATRASGTNAVRYGTMRETVLSLTVVLASGEVIRTSSRARKSAAGYDLTRLFVGSEGTLGIITEVTLRLSGIPEATAAATCRFPDLVSAAEAAIAVIQYGVPIARVELMEKRLIDYTNAYSRLALPAGDTLVFEFHGSEKGVAEQVETVRGIVADYGAAAFDWATTPEDRSRLWKARHDAFYAVLATRTGSKGWATDICVPISELAGAVALARDLVEEAGATAAILGHVGDGNFHVMFAVDPDDRTELDRVGSINAELIRHAISVGGTSTGEHGIGSGKIAYMREEYDEAALAVMRAIKAAVDPGNILNPGKILPPPA